MTTHTRPARTAVAATLATAALASGLALAAPAQAAAPTVATTAATTSTATPAHVDAGRPVAVPAASGIRSMKLIAVHGGRASSGTYARVTGVFDVVTTTPMLLDLRVQLLDARGKEIARGTALNPAYTVGRHRLVTTNLVRLPAGKTPARFRLSLARTLPMRYPTFTTFSAPRLTRANGVPALTGTYRYTGRLRSGMDSRGACVVGRRIYQGMDTLNDNPTRASRGGRTGTYVIPLYDARGLSLAGARCYASV